jgi:hypothetical protein
MVAPVALAVKHAQPADIQTGRILVDHLHETGPPNLDI